MERENAVAAFSRKFHSLSCTQRKLKIFNFYSLTSAAFSRLLEQYVAMVIAMFPVPARINFGERIKKNFIFHFNEFDVFGTTIICFSVKADAFCPLF